MIGRFNGSRRGPITRTLGGVAILGVGFAAATCSPSDAPTPAAQANGTATTRPGDAESTNAILQIRPDFLDYVIERVEDGSGDWRAVVEDVRASCLSADGQDPLD